MYFISEINTITIIITMFMLFVSVVLKNLLGNKHLLIIPIKYNLF